MNRGDVSAVLAQPLSVQLLESAIPARMAYTAADGTPRVIPMGTLWTGGDMVCCTAVNSPKVRALQANRRVALTIDTEGFPPQALLLRGAATVELVDGIPDEYFAASRKTVPADGWESFETTVRSLYRQMAKITIEPDWAKLLDFDTTLPKAIEELIAERGAPR